MSKNTGVAAPRETREVGRRGKWDAITLLAATAAAQTRPGRTDPIGSSGVERRDAAQRFDSTEFGSVVA